MSEPKGVSHQEATAAPAIDATRFEAIKQAHRTTLQLRKYIECDGYYCKSKCQKKVWQKTHKDECHPSGSKPSEVTKTWKLRMPIFIAGAETSRRRHRVVCSNDVRNLHGRRDQKSCLSCLRTYCVFRLLHKLQDHQEGKDVACPFCRCVIKTNIAKLALEKAYAFFNLRMQNSKFPLDASAETYQNTVKLVDAVLENNPKKIYALFLKGQVLSLSEPEKAIKIFDQLLLLENEGF